MSLSREELRDLARLVLITTPDEIGCDDWAEVAPAYAELVSASAAVPEEVRRAALHLDVCSNCAEEFQACLEALRSGE